VSGFECSLTPEPHTNITLLSQIGGEPGPLWQFFYSYMGIFLQLYRSQKTVMHVFIDLSGSIMEGYSLRPHYSPNTLLSWGAKS